MKHALLYSDQIETITPYSLIVNIALTFKESSFDNWVKDVEWCEHICSAFLWSGLVKVLINFTSILFQWCQIKPPVTSRWDEGKKHDFFTLKKKEQICSTSSTKGAPGNCFMCLACREL